MMILWWLILWWSFFSYTWCGGEPQQQQQQQREMGFYRFDKKVVKICNGWNFGVAVAVVKPI
jgi:hypothetical protein